MTREKLFIGLAVAILLMAVVGLVWFKIYVTVPHYLVYRNQTQSYSLLIPVWWGKNYAVLEQAEGQQVSFIYQPAQEKPYLLFAIVKTTPAEWAKIENDPQRAIVSRLLTEQDTEVFYSYWLANNPYRGRDTSRYLAMVRDLTSIFDSFTLASSRLVPPNKEQVFCIQVITPARDLTSGNIKNYPSPCDVPLGWEIIEP